jgi:hypothetical protein
MFNISEWGGKMKGKKTSFCAKILATKNKKKKK